jgi:DNA repair protein RecO (recombination protein O)
MLDVVAYHKPGKGLSRIKEVRPYYIYTRLPYEIKRSAIAQYIIELLRHTIREPEPNESLFDFCEGVLIALDTSKENLNSLPLRFSWQLMDHLGIKSDPMENDGFGYFDLRNGLFTSQTPQHLDYVQGKLVNSIYDLLSNEDLLAPIESLNRDERRDLLHHTQQYYRWHIENFKNLNSPRILETVFRS